MRRLRCRLSKRNITTCSCPNSQTRQIFFPLKRSCPYSLALQYVSSSRLSIRLSSQPPSLLSLLTSTPVRISLTVESKHVAHLLLFFLPQDPYHPSYHQRTSLPQQPSNLCMAAFLTSSVEKPLSVSPYAYS